MALTTPFINSVTAFDANNTKKIDVSVLGGDAITRVYLYVYDSNNVLQTTIPQYVVDNNPNSLRTFQVTMPLYTVTNNSSYKLRARTYDGTNYSEYSQYEIFTCYVAPSFSFQYYNGSSYVALSDGFTIPSENLNVQLTFDKNDVQSPAILNNVQISVYGIDANSTQTLVYQGDMLYVSPLQQTLNGFVPTSGQYAQYQSYKIVASGSTVDGFDFSSEVSNLSCSYNISLGTILELNNLCRQGVVRIKTTYTSSSTISYYNLQYKRADETNWLTIITDTNPNEGTDAWLNFTVDFPFCANNILYDFRMVLFAADNSVVASDIVQVLSRFGRSYICDATTMYDITKEWAIGSYNTYNANAVYQPFNAKFPMVTKNVSGQYRSGQYTAVLLAPTSESNTSAYIDRNAQVVLKDDFENWLSDGNAKVIKDYNGSVRIVAVIDNLPSTYYQQLGNGIASSSFNWTEIGDFTQKYFDYLGLTNSFEKIYY